MMLIIEKKGDIATLYAIGAKRSLVRKIFSTEGVLIGARGIVGGLVLGLAVCVAQMKWGLIRMPGSTFIIDFYPVEKPTFGSVELPALVGQAANGEDFTVELIGLCTDICVVSNALLLKAHFPEKTIRVDAACCAGVTPESHEAALKTMQMCQVEVV